VYTARAAQSPGTRNYDRQTPLPRAATTLAKQMLGLGMHRPDTFTYAHLHEAVDKLVTAQCVTDDPAPLLQAAGEVLALPAHRARPQAGRADSQPPRPPPRPASPRRRLQPALPGARMLTGNSARHRPTDNISAPATDINSAFPLTTFPRSTP
jgi:hypothetical protein